MEYAAQTPHHPSSSSVGQRFSWMTRKTKRACPPLVLRQTLIIETVVQSMALIVLGASISSF
jgi:hypothetical protein